MTGRAMGYLSRLAGILPMLGHGQDGRSTTASADVTMDTEVHDGEV